MNEDNNTQDDSKYPCKNIIEDRGTLCDARINNPNCPNFADEAWGPFLDKCPPDE